jgi:hypothetical protein
LKSIVHGDTFIFSMSGESAISGSLGHWSGSAGDGIPMSQNAINISNDSVLDGGLDPSAKPPNRRPPSKSSSAGRSSRSSKAPSVALPPPQVLSQQSVELQEFRISGSGSDDEFQPLVDSPAPVDADDSLELARLQDVVREQRTIIEHQKQTIKMLMSESTSPQEIAALRATLAAKSPLLQLVAAPSVSEQRAAKQLRADNAAMRREIEEMEVRHLGEMKQLRVLCASLAARSMPADGCAHCKRAIRELQLENQRLMMKLEPIV